MDDKKFSEMLVSITTELTSAQIRKLALLVVQVAKADQKVRADVAKQSLRAGMRVTWKKGLTQYTGKVLKVNKTTAMVLEERPDGFKQQWKVHVNLLKAA